MMRPCFTAAVLAGLLGGCGPLVQVGTPQAPPAELLVTTAIARPGVPSGHAPLDLDKAITVALPILPGTLQTLRIPVSVSDTQVQYVRGATWAELPSRQFQRLLADTLAARGLSVVDPRASGRSADRQLSGQLLAFGVDTRGPLSVRVRYDATLAEPGGLRQRRFEQEEPLGAVQPGPVAEALNRAANAVAADVAAWIAVPVGN
jgi:cholesterol transport system auxiliary component